VAYFFTPDVLRQKLDPKATKGTYVGESEEQKGSRVFVEATGRTHISRHVKVYENLPYWSVTPLGNEIQPTTPNVRVSATSTSEDVFNPVSNDTPVITQQLDRLAAVPVRKPLRGLVPKKLFPIEMEGTCVVHQSPDLSMSAFISMAFKAISLFYEPKTFTEAMSGTEGDLWRKAADHEMEAHIKNQTWTLVPLPTGRTCILSGWDFKLKTDKLGLPSRRKARFFAKGYRQVKGVDYQESFAPVVRYDSLRVIIAIAAARDLELIQLDVTTAFLNGLIDEVVFIAQ
jgi:hypothetical protein